MGQSLTFIDWLTASAYFLAFACTIIRTALLNPALSWGPTAPFFERLVYEALAAAAGLRGWLIITGEIRPTISGVALAVSLAMVAGLGLWNLAWPEVGPRLTTWWRQRVEAARGWLPKGL